MYVAPEPWSCSSFVLTDECLNDLEADLDNVKTISNLAAINEIVQSIYRLNLPLCCRMRCARSIVAPA